MAGPLLGPCVCGSFSAPGFPFIHIYEDIVDVNDMMMTLFIKRVNGDVMFDYAGGAMTSCRS